MKQELEERAHKLEAALLVNQGEINPLKRISLQLKLAEDAVREVVENLVVKDGDYFARNYRVECDKHDLPYFFSKLLFLKKCYRLEELRCFSSREKVRLYCEQELEECYRFFSRHRPFCQYYLSEKKEEDSFIFSEDNPGTYYSEIQDTLIPRNLSNGCFLATLLLTYQQYGERLREELGFEHPQFTSSDSGVWMNIAETEIVELGEALRKLSRLYDKDNCPTQKYMVDWAKRSFGKEVLNYHRAIYSPMDESRPAAAVIWFLRECEDGKYCTLPHAIELIQTPRTMLLNVLQMIPESRMLVQPFVDAYQNKSLEQLDGQISTVMIAMGRLASPDVYYVLTGNDFTMDINNPAKPKIFCLGGDSARQDALRPILSLFIDQVNKQCNIPNRYPCALVCDEFSTVRAAGMLTTFATARSNNIVPVIAVQDISQLNLQYSEEETNAVLNVSGNFFCGQAAGKTAKWVSDRFPKVQKDRTAVSTNSSDTSVSVAPHWEETVTSATIASLSSGEFVGVVADDPDQEMVLKAFHAKILKEEEPEVRGMDLPVIRSIDDNTVREHAESIRKEVRELVARQMELMTRDTELSGLMVKEHV